ncbi:uncharacterized protein LOC108194459 [Daucus carota subsp. sativus]|uniref:Uncharacterized protein n=1 Tax=Daucus carota subsp. sativus TaxID=79200 RepID=A0A164SSZ2_DAUCS|nr:PREDICTED: uncharacterized protein LOC108194459 [Daucus carota subsp. sativus]
MLQQILVLLLSLILVVLFIVTGSHLTIVVSCKGVRGSAELLQKNDASEEAVLVNNVHTAAVRELKLKTGWKIAVDKVHSRRDSFLSPTQRSSSTAREKVESPAEIADRKRELKVGRRSLIVKEKKNESGFVAYSADYGKPRHHPPKNN